MTVAALGSWLALTIGLTLLPGADTLVVLRAALRSGSRPALLSGLGVNAGVLAWGVAAAVGLAALVSRRPLLYDGIRLLGAAYLVWLGLRTLFGRSSLAPDLSPADLPAGSHRPFATGLLTNLLNPKVGVFYLSVLPQFVPAGSGFTASLGWGVALALIHNAEGLAWFALLAFGVDRARALLRRARFVRAVESVVGLTLVAFGIRVATGARLR
jgi:threonine/homoserine/homoserine lactone efflux protein